MNPIRNPRKRTSFDSGASFPELRYRVSCSGLPRPPHLASMEFPLDKNKVCAEECTKPVAIVSNEPRMGTNGEQMDFQALLCAALGVDFQEQVRSLLVGSPSREIVYRANAHNPNVIHVLWYACNGTKVYPIEITWWWAVPRVRIMDLPCVAASGRRAAFAALSDTIDAAGAHLPEQKLKELWDAAKRVHGST